MGTSGWLITDRFQPNSAISRTPSATASSRVRNSRCQVTPPRPNALRYLATTLPGCPSLRAYLGRSPVRARMSSPSPITQSLPPSASAPSRHRCR